MSLPNQIANDNRYAFDVNELFKGQPQLNSQDLLIKEIANLRDEIVALRTELTMAPSLIVTGRQALDEFKRLTPKL